MIDLFIIHSGTDSNYVLENVVPALVNTEGDKKGHTNVLLLASDNYKDKYTSAKNKINNPDNFEVCFTGKHWKKDAKKCIKRARAVLVIVGEDTINKKETVGFEIGYARKHSKLILMHKTAPDIKLPDFLKEKDKFTGKIKGIVEEKSLEQIRERIDNFDIGYYNIFSDGIYKEGSQDNELMERIMEQYQMYQRTSEDLVARRQSVSSFYISVNSAIVAAYGVIIGLVDYPNNFIFTISMAMVGIILDISWIKILETYGSLNAAKMKVISMMERELPIRLYDTEWIVMRDKMNSKKYVSFTDSEKFVPKIFVCVYIIMLIVTIASIIIH